MLWALIDLSNARRSYSSTQNPLTVKGLNDHTKSALLLIKVTAKSFKFFVYMFASKYYHYLHLLSGKVHKLFYFSPIILISCLPRFEISSLGEMQSIDRELFSELIESPIIPPFHYMCTPSMNE